MFLTTRAQSAAMKKQDPKPVSRKNPKRGSTRGVIVNMGSCSSFVSTPQIGQYTTSKHAVLGLTKNAGTSPSPYYPGIDCSRAGSRVKMSPRSTMHDFQAPCPIFLLTLVKWLESMLTCLICHHSSRQRPSPNSRQLPMPLLGRHSNGFPSSLREPSVADHHGERNPNGPDCRGG